MLPPKFKDHPVECHQHLLFPSNVFDLLPDNHDCFVYADIVNCIDTSRVEALYHPLGQRAYHPRHIVAILIYAYSHGVFSSREIQRRCSQDLAFMYISQMNCPNFRVLSDFRKDHCAFFHDCFTQSVKLALELKLASLGHISLDGSKFKANSSKHKAMSYGRLKSQERALTEAIDGLIEQATRSDAEEDAAEQDAHGDGVADELALKKQRLAKIQAAKQALEDREAALKPGEPVEDSKQISFADHDARIMGKQGGYDYNYNGQISVDSDHQIIVGQHVSQRANDQQEVEPALDALAQTIGERPIDKLSLDNGYYSGTNLQALEQADIDAYVATDRGEKPAGEALEASDRPFVKADFVYRPEDDCFLCPTGETLHTNPASTAKKKLYRAPRATCQGCVFRARCGTAKREPGRVIRTDRHEHGRQAMNRKMATPEAKAVYKRRKVIVEPAFGQIKNSGFRGFSVRGKAKVGGEFSLVCAAHNFKKMVSATFAGLIRPKHEHGLKCPA